MIEQNRNSGDGDHVLSRRSAGGTAPTIDPPHASVNHSETQRGLPFRQRPGAIDRAPSRDNERPTAPMRHVTSLRLLPLAAAALALALSACSSGGGGMLSAGLTQRMDQPGATLNRAEALGIVNDYRRAVGAPALRADPSLDSSAQALAIQYAQTGSPPRPPAGTVMRPSAGYANFAETFSGWRGSPADANAMGDRTVSRAGIAAYYDANSTYGIHWVLLLAP